MTDHIIADSGTDSGNGSRRWRDRAVLIGVAAVLVVLFAAMPAWRGVPGAAFTSEAMDQATFEARLEAQNARYGIGEKDGVPAVRPPPGDVWLAAERWDFSPLLVLETGQTYRIHVASRDTLHGVVISGHEALLVPGRAAVLTLTPAEAGDIRLVCSEYCGLEHNKMHSLLTVTDPP